MIKWVILVLVLLAVFFIIPVIPVSSVSFFGANAKTTASLSYNFVQCGEVYSTYSAGFFGNGSSFRWICGNSSR